MVGPSMSEDETRNAYTRLRVAFVLLVAVTGTLIAFQADATPVQIGLATLGSLILGIALILFLGRWSKEFTASNRR